jgi:hypothetical protein
VECGDNPPERRDVDGDSGIILTRRGIFGIIVDIIKLWLQGKLRANGDVDVETALKAHPLLELYVPGKSEAVDPALETEFHGKHVGCEKQ